MKNDVDNVFAPSGKGKLIVLWGKRTEPYCGQYWKE